MAKKKSETKKKIEPPRPICAGQIESRRIMRDQPQPASELETLRQIATCARELLDAYEVWNEIRDEDGSSEADRDHAAQRVAEAASAADISLHAWEWWTFADGARVARKRPW